MVRWSLLLVLAAPAFAGGGLLDNGDFAAGLRGWATWSPAPDRLQLEAGGGAARLTVSTGAPIAGCLYATAGALDPAHTYTATVDIDATALTAGRALLRIEFWGGGDRTGPTSSLASPPIAAGRTGRAAVEFRPPAAARLVRVVGQVVDAVGTAAFDNFVLLDRTAPVVRAMGRRLFNVGEPVSLALDLSNGTPQTFAAPLRISVRRGATAVKSQSVNAAVPSGENRALPVALGALPRGAYEVAWAALGISGQRTVHVLELPGAPFNRYGGWAEAAGTATGFFHTERLDHRWWLIDPAGQRFWSTGVDGVGEQGTGSPALSYVPYRRSVSALYADDEAWAANTTSRLRWWGFNTLGSWSSTLAESAGLPYCHILSIGRRATAKQFTQAPRGHSPWSWFPDVFAPEFAAGARRVAQAECAPRRDDPLLIGWFLDNEFRWEGLWEAAFATAPDSPGRDAFVACARAHFADAGKLREACGVASFDALRTVTAPLPGNQAWRDAWTEAVAERYYSVCVAAVRQADPHHLVISERYAGHAPDPSARAAGRHCDVVCVNFYNDGLAYGISPNLQQRFTELGELTGKPLLIGEWSFKAMDSGLPNTKGAATPVDTQEDRAVGYAAFLATAAANPYLVGAHWFQFSDQPLEGRFDGENSNYGLVDQCDTPHGWLVSAAAYANRLVYPLARAARFGTRSVEVLPAGPQWVRATGDGFTIGGSDTHRLTATAPAVGGQLRIGGGVTAEWREGQATLRASAQATYELRRGDELLDGTVTRPDASLEPAFLPAGVATHRVTLVVHNPTGRTLAGPWEVVPSPGWTMAALPPLDLAPGATVRLETTLTAAADATVWPRLVVWAPFVGVVRWRVGPPVDLVALPTADGTELVVRRRSAGAEPAQLAVTSQPAGLSGSSTWTWAPGETLHRLRLTGTRPAGARAVSISGTYRAGAGPASEVGTRLYDVGGELRTQPDWPLSEGVTWQPDRGAIRLQRQTPGTTSCAFPAVPLDATCRSLVVSARVRWQNVVRGPRETWHRANVAVFFTDANGAYLRHEDLLLGDGTADWHQTTRAFRVPPGAVGMSVQARLLDCTGELWIDRVSVVDCPADLSRQLVVDRR